MATADVVRDTVDTVVYLLRASLGPLVAADRIFAATPDEFGVLQTPEDPTITLFLYRAAVNPTLRNTPRPPLASGRSTRPLLPLELGLLITPWARETRDEYRIVGRILQALYDASELGPADLQGDSWEAGDTVQLVLDSLPVEDHYRIWDSTNLPYRLSLTYIARVVGIEPAVERELPVVASATFRGEAP